MSTSAKRVARGAAFMDEFYPGWERKVDVTILDISSPDQCICGQVIPDLFPWSAASEVFYGRDYEFSMAECGFADSEDGDAWVSLIKTRFDTGALSDMREESV
jgi:hypothetical protein